ncbi:histidine phosphatase family protein [bacterium]|nr:histidine phosphatase family protein [bacterium]
MKVLFIRHGECLADAEKLESAYPDFLNGLTDEGVRQTQNIAGTIRDKVEAIYASPYQRTVSTARIFADTRKEKYDVVVDDRLREINYDSENKREVITRMFGFLIDVFNKHKENEAVLAVSHTGAISVTEYEFSAVTGEYTEAININVKDFVLNETNVAKLKEYLDDSNEDEVQKRVKYVEKYTVKDSVFGPAIVNMVKNTLDDIDVSEDIIEKFISGIYKDEIKQIYSCIDKNNLPKSEPVLITVFKDASNFIRHFVTHYKSMISNFVFIDNGSTDDSVNILKQMSRDDKNLHIDIWYTDAKYNGTRTGGWRQRLISLYGINRWWLVVDIDELFVFDGKDISAMVKHLENIGGKAAMAFMIDMYPKCSFKQKDDIKTEDIMQEYRFFDKTGYSKNYNNKYRYRFFGGLRKRVFNLIPSLQKFPLVYITENTLGINSHFWYPYSVNYNSEQCAFLLHYKFLPNDITKYIDRAASGVYYADSREYKAYLQKIGMESDLRFYDPEVSQEYTGFDSLKSIVAQENQT